MQRRVSSQKLRFQRTPRLEQLEARLTFSVDALSESISALLANDALPVVSAVAAVKNQPPTFATPVRASGATQVTSDRTLLSVLGKDDAGESKLSYRWQLIAAPKGATVSFSHNNSNSAKQSTAVFNKAGEYTLSVTMTDAGGLKTSAQYKYNVVQSLTQLTLLDQRKQELATGAKLSTGSTTSSMFLIGKDQFKNVMPVPSSVAWNVGSQTTGAKATISNNAGAVTIAFNKAAEYQVRVSSGKLSATLSVSVVPTLTSIAVTPGMEAAPAGTRQQFSARGLDQFKNPLVRQPVFAWSASAGSVNASGLWSAPAQASVVKVQVAGGGVTAGVSIRVTGAGTASDFQNPALAGLIHSYFADGSITRPDMIQILRSAGIDGRVDTTELSDLRNLVNNAAKYKIPDDVRVLASDVINENPANATYQGRPAGNLAVGASAAQLNLLVDKWFYGTDRPTLTSAGLTYQVAAGNLFSRTPSHLDQQQGALGDCYFISTLGIIASKTPDVIRDMFIDNQDGTFTVRFFSGVYGAFIGPDGSISDGFKSGAGKADYVTVDRWLPAQAGRFVYSNAGAMLNSNGTSLWLALAEKAYAQWNATGKSGRSGAANTYRSIEGGWMSTVSAQVLGYNANSYSLASTAQQKLIDALTAGRAVTIGTTANAQTGGLVGSHAYSIVGYNSQTGQFQLHNPWGNNHPVGLTYSQLQANCSYFVVADSAQFKVAVKGVATPRVSSGHEAAAWETSLSRPDFHRPVFERAAFAADQGLTERPVAWSSRGGESAASDSWANVYVPERSTIETDTTDVSNAIDSTLEAIDELFGLLAEDDALFA